MKISRWITGALTGVVLVSNVSHQVSAAVGDNNPKGDEHTTFGIMEAAQDPSNVQFEVPLYVTMAVVSNEADVKTPEGYNIINTAGTGGVSIGITSMSIEAKGTWSTVADESGLDDATKIVLSIGKCTMPAVGVGLGRQPVTLGGDFGTAAAPTQIAPGASLSADAKGMAITGKVQSAARTEKKAAAQFQIRYTVAALDATGQPLGAVYVGDDKTAAGL